MLVTASRCDEWEGAFGTAPSRGESRRVWGSPTAQRNPPQGQATPAHSVKLFGDSTCPRPPRNWKTWDPGVNDRQRHQHRRMAQLTPGETRRLISTESGIRRMERAMKSDGVLTKAERTQLHAALNQASQAIAALKHNDADRPTVRRRLLRVIDGDEACAGRARTACRPAGGPRGRVRGPRRSALRVAGVPTASRPSRWPAAPRAAGHLRPPVHQIVQLPERGIARCLSTPSTYGTRHRLARHLQGISVRRTSRTMQCTSSKGLVPMCKATQVAVQQAFQECPECGYQNGFHVALRRVEPNGDDRKLAAYLICPSCSAVFDVGLRICLPDPR